MNGSEQKIEIFRPFEEALGLTKKILFQPFDLKKWMVIGFAAFLANLSGGFHFNPGAFNWDRRHWHDWPAPDWAAQLHQLPGWALTAGIVVISIVIVAIMLVFGWLSARGRFIFIDCVVKNRGAIALPWREFRKEGNSLFLFSLLIALGFILVAGVLALAVLIPLIRYGRYSTHLHGVFAISGAISFGLILFLCALAWALIWHFMQPVMYRQRCRAREAFKRVASLLSAYPGEFVLYCLFVIVLGIGMALAACVMVCATCCIAAIPYIGTVILLPFFVVFRSFSLCFLRQFGPDYDVWQGVSEPEAISPPPAPPPLQT